MITSIYKALRHAIPGDGGTVAAANPADGLTRSGFLRVLAAGCVVPGIAATAAQQVAARGRGVAPVKSLDRFYDAWQDRFNAADIEGMVDLYVADVVYINPEGKTLMGKAGVRKDFEGLFALKPRIDLHDRKHVLYRDIALTTNHWSLTYVEANGTKQEQTGGGIEVVRRQPDGGWRFIIDDASRSAV